MVHLKRVILAVVLALMAGAPLSVSAQGWKVTLSANPYGPEHILAIDKESQTFFLLTQKSPIKMVRKFPCTTGQAEGDKQQRGDLRTPEGVYFIGGVVQGGLDYELYGNVAYSLNFPNPVDRIKGKTGSGIWLHGRGKELMPMDTRGCVALDTVDIESMHSEIRGGMPTLIAQKLAWTEDDGDYVGTVESVVGELNGWASDWQNRSDAFFSRYDGLKFSISEGDSFDGFVSHKKGIFSAQPWIQVMVENIKALPGPDYWVTCFDQYYRTADLVSTVGKRFYWQRGDDGRWRIVGREYTEPSTDLAPLYLEAKRAEVEAMLRAWTQNWADGNVDSYLSHYVSEAVQGKRRGVEEIRKQKKALWAVKPPANITISDLDVDLSPSGLQATFVQKYKDATGYTDEGAKTLVLAPHSGDWKIVREDWRSLK